MNLNSTMAKSNISFFSHLVQLLLPSGPNANLAVSKRFEKEIRSVQALINHILPKLSDLSKARKRFT